MIRKATISDAGAIAKHLFYAMEHIVYQFIEENNRQEAIAFLQHFSARTSNLYSFENCYVWDTLSGVIGVANLYDGSDLHRLRLPVENYIRRHYNAHFSVEDETQSGEIYIDTFAVSPSYRGRGIGGQMLRFLIEEWCERQGKTLGLLVEKEKLDVQMFYYKLGFKRVGEKRLMKQPMIHLQYYP